jgi:hypothetical protein
MPINFPDSLYVGISKGRNYKILGAYPPDEMMRANSSNCTFIFTSLGSAPCNEQSAGEFLGPQLFRHVQGKLEPSWNQAVVS